MSIKNILSVACCLALTGLFSCQEKSENTEVIAEPIAPTPIYTEYGIPAHDYIAHTGMIKSGQTLGGMFEREGVSRRVSAQLNTLSKDLFDVRQVRAGNQYRVYCTPDSLQEPVYIVYHHGVINHTVFGVKDSLTIRHFAKDVRKETKTAHAVIHSSLWNATTEANISHEIAIDLSDIYAWVIDFFGIQDGDAFSVYYDENFVDTLSVGIGDIHAAKFTHNGVDYYTYHYANDSLGIDGYWDENGNSMRKAFLKAPLKYSRISSKFTYHRRHPIYKIVRPHTGVDYAAPMGTPVVALGDGKCIFRAYKGGGGNTIKIKHNSVYTTAYLHLSKYAKGLYVGKQVKQGEVIGYVGSTGASTGPHLDFRVWKNGTPVDPLKMESPSVEPIPAAIMDDFKAVRDSLHLKLQ